MSGVRPGEFVMLHSEPMASHQVRPVTLNVLQATFAPNVASSRNAGPIHPKDTCSPVLPIRLFRQRTCLYPSLVAGAWLALRGQVGGMHSLSLLSSSYSWLRERVRVSQSKRGPAAIMTPHRARGARRGPAGSPAAPAPRPPPPHRFSHPRARLPGLCSLPPTPDLILAFFTLSL